MELKDAKIIIFGCQQIAVDCVESIKKRGGKITAIVTYELPLDKKYGYASVYDVAKKYRIPVYQPEMLDKAFIKKIKDLDPDLILSIYYRKIFPPELIRLPPLGCVNIHPGLLPNYRGPIPTFWAIYNGEKKCGLTLHYIDEGIDTGPIIKQISFPISPAISGFELNNQAMTEGARLILDNLEGIVKGGVKVKKQNANAGSYYGSFRNRLRFIDWYKSSKAINDQIRAMTRPYMGCLTSILDEDIIIWKTKVLKNRFPIRSPGRILHVSSDGSFAVSTSNGSLKITDYEFVRKVKDKNFYIAKGRTLS